MAATSARAVRHSSPPCGTARAQHPRPACRGSPGRAAARMTGLPSPSPRPPANRQPRSRRRGKRATGGPSSGFPCGAVGASGSGAFLAFLSSSLCCGGLFCERRGQNSARGLVGAGSVRRCGTWTTIQGSSGPDAGAGVTHAGESTGQTLGWRLARWLFSSRASFAAADLPAPVTPHYRRAV
jgi:hypothetical protein